MLSLQANAAKDAISTQHARRVFLMLRIASGVLMAMGLVWAITFTLRGDWYIVGIDVLMLIVGALVWVLAGRSQIRLAFYVMFVTIFVVVTTISLLQDIPNLAAPRTTHHFLLVLAVSVLLFMRDERALLRHGMALLCMVVYIALGSAQFGLVTAYVVPDSVRIGGSWVNTGVAILTLYGLIHIMVNEFSVVSEPERDLRRGLLQGEFFLVYQPQVTSEGRLLGAEALLRWQHPQRGLVSPAEFIPLAEHTGLIIPLGLLALETACHQLMRWSNQPALVAVSLSVNVSAQQFRQPDFVSQVKEILRHTGAPSKALKLELTESLLVHDIEDIVVKMRQLRDFGVGFSLDDFGTGFSSLNYLKRLPLDQLKIDQSFVRDVLTDPNGAAIARTVIALGKSMGLAVIAEGVETEGQRGFLVKNDCHIFQGYLFSKPLPAPLFLEFANNVA
jgi:EAL domain-containing protein (putative c-di-GMP-specific phosphodiesterase class I)